MTATTEQQLLSNSTPEQEEAILHVFAEVAPLDLDVVGVDTARRIAAGGSFQQVEGGRHLDLSATIGLLSGIATLAQAMLLTGFWVKKKIAEERKKEAAEWEALFGDIREKACRDEPLKRLLEQHPGLLRAIAEALDSYLATQERLGANGSSAPDA